jgi:NitT/TauT family transport system substrate-binding protein
MFTRLRFVLLLILLLMAAFAPVSAQDAPALVDQTFFMTFVPNVQFAPIYLALEQGYLSAAGINLTIEHGDENVGVDLIATNQRQFGLISGEEVLKARAQGRPVVSVYEWFQKYPVGIVYPLDQGIESPADLVGRRVGIPGRFGASYNGLLALLSANDLQETDIQLEPIGFNAADVFCVGGVQASVVYINNEPLQIESRIANGECQGYSGVGVFRVSDYADMVSNGLVTNEETIANNPELVRAMVAVWDQGVREAILNPAAAYLASATYVENLPLSDRLRGVLESLAAARAEELPDDRYPAFEERDLYWNQFLNTVEFDADPAEMLQIRVLVNTIQLWDAPEPGIADSESWAATADVLRAMGALEADMDVTQAFTNCFIAAAVRDLDINCGD